MDCPPALPQGLPEVFWMVSLLVSMTHDRHKGSAFDVPTPKSLQNTVAWTPVQTMNFTKASLMKKHIMQAKRNARIKNTSNYIKSKCTQGGK